MTRVDTALARRCSAALARASGAVVGMVLAVSGPGCGGSATPDAAVEITPQWWQPKTGEVKDWDIQLNPPFDLSRPQKMYLLDLWDLVPLEMTLDYGDGTPLPVHPGALAGRITELHARTPPAVVICRIETGILETGRPDAMKFPGTATGDDIAMFSLAGRSSGKLLDIRAASRAAWAPILFKRFDLARQIGCDGILPAHNEVAIHKQQARFTIESEDVRSWYEEVARQGHDRMLSTGMHGGDSDPQFYEQLADSFDWALVERCGELQICDMSHPFSNLERSVLALEYRTSLPDPGAMPPKGPADQSETVCSKQDKRIVEGLLKDDDLSSTLWKACEPDGLNQAARR